jgi:arsenate reductase
VNKRTIYKQRTSSSETKSEKKEKNTMIEIYHNPRCKKSRDGVAYIENAQFDFEIIKYLETPPTTQEIRELLEKLNYTPLQLVRKNEAIWKENYKGKELTDNEIIHALAKFPKLIERPIVIKKNKAVVARPTEAIENILKK